MAIILTKPTIHLVLRLLIVVGVLSWVTPAVVHGALININTADIATLDTLPGIGPTTAQYIVDGRPYASIEEISKVKGIGEPGDKSYEDIKNLITAEGGDAQTASTQNSQSSSDTPKTETVTQYEFQTVTVEPPQDIYLRVPEAIHAVVYTRVVFEAELYDAQGKTVEGGRVFWSFGDGTSYEGRSVTHQYAYPGTYVARVRAEYGQLSDGANITVEVVAFDASISVDAGGEWVAIHNRSSVMLDLSGWRLHTGLQYFMIPSDTFILPDAEVRFPTDVTKLTTLSGTKRAFLVTPNGTTVADSAGAFEVGPGTAEEVQGDGGEEAGKTYEQNEAPGNATSTETATASAEGDDGAELAATSVAVSTATEGEAEEGSQDAAQQSATSDDAYSPVASTTQVAAAATATWGGGMFSGSLAWVLGLGVLLAVAGAGVIFARRSETLADSFEIIDDTRDNQ